LISATHSPLPTGCPFRLLTQLIASSAVLPLVEAKAAVGSRQATMITARMRQRTRLFIRHLLSKKLCKRAFLTGRAQKARREMPRLLWIQYTHFAVFGQQKYQKNLTNHD
jgi:hypothetical protein